MLQFLRWPLILSVLLLISNTALGRITTSTPNMRSQTGLLMVFLTDEITLSDASMLTKKAGEMQRKYGSHWRILVKLNSNGGNVSAALQIGRLLRKVGAMATVEADAICLSSCVYILAGASNRAVDGNVGIHRPYEPEGKEISQAVQREKYLKLGAEIKAYLSEMNIPLKLYDDELYISPENVKILTADELQGYGH